MEEAYILCDEIIIMDQGKILIQGSPDRLLSEHFQGVSVVIPKTDLSPAQLAELRVESDLVTEREDHYEIQTHSLEQFISRLQRLGVRLTGMRIRSQTLEDLFLKLTGKELRA
jgi:ABC-2 type transport system ATP-binding protein